MSSENLELGRKGEAIAAAFLKNRGYKIISADYRMSLGQIDIIAKDKNTICFVEVKSRRSAKFGAPDEAVDIIKQKKISRAALIFLKKNKLLECPARFDVVSIYYGADKPQTELIKDAFPLNKNYIY